MAGVILDAELVIDQVRHLRTGQSGVSEPSFSGPCNSNSCSRSRSASVSAGFLPARPAFFLGPPPPAAPELICPSTHGLTEAIHIEETDAHFAIEWQGNDSIGVTPSSTWTELGSHRERSRVSDGPNCETLLIGKFG